MARAPAAGEGRGEGAIDHRWIRVADLAAARASYEERGFEVSWSHDDPPRAGFRRGGDSFSLVEDGAPTENLHVEFADGG